MNTTFDPLNLDELIKSYHEVKDFKFNYSLEILERFHGEIEYNEKKYPKFNLVENQGEGHFNLSSTAVCVNAMSQYHRFWKQNKKLPIAKRVRVEEERIKFEDYNAYIVDMLDSCAIDEKNIDIFSILNILSFLKIIDKGIAPNKQSFYNQKNKICVDKIIARIIDNYGKHGFKQWDNAHPFLYYKFLNILLDWDVVKFNEYFESFYHKAKYEMYRQITLHAADDMSLFDAKRLIYSLLTVTLKNKYSNNLIKNLALDLIFKKQLATGLWPAGHVIDATFESSSRLSTSHPIISSVECMNDILSQEHIKEELLKKYLPNVKLTYDWISLRRRQDQRTTIPLGWYPEYESPKIPKSWVAGHTLIFIKKYCDLLSDLITKSVGQDLKMEKITELETPWDALRDSFTTKSIIANMMDCSSGKCISNQEYKSALLFGPPGTGKTSLPKALAQKMKWNYVEITPGQFVDQGEQYIIPKANEIFKKLYQLKDTVIFFDEVDQLVVNREEGNWSSNWVVTALLPKFQELRKRKDIIFFLATNHIENADAAALRRGRIDFVLPLGGLSWRERLMMLRDSIRSYSKEELKLKNLHGYDLLYNKSGDLISDGDIMKLGKPDVVEEIRIFLKKTNYMLAVEIRNILNHIFSCKKWDSDAELLYDMFFTSSNEDYKKHEYESLNKLQDELSKLKEHELGKIIKVPPELQKFRMMDIVRDNIYD
jgi:hypothetical protein